MDDNKYFFLCGQMSARHGELSVKMSKTDLKRSSLVICGPSGYGKSTFLARLMSDLPCVKFLERIKDIHQSRESKEQIEGVFIGGSGGSTTIVPNFFDLDGDLITDLAGFADTSEDMAPIITILNYTLFTKLSSSRFIVVFDAAQLSNFAIFNTSIKSYVTEFMNLFTEPNFLRCLNGTIFVITKIDRSEHDIIRAVKELSKYFQAPNIDELSDSDRVDYMTDLIRDLLGKYLARIKDQSASSVIKQMSDSFIIADYRSMSTRAILEKLSKIKQLDGITCSDMVFDTVSSTNKLCNKALSMIDSIHVDIDNLDHSHTRLKEEMMLNQDRVKKDLGSLHDRITECEKVVSKTKEDLLLREIRQAEILSFQNNYPKEKEEAEFALKNVRESYERIKSDFKDMSMIHLETIRSIKVEKRFRTDYRIQAEVCRPFGVDAQPVIYTMSVNDYQDKIVGIKGCQKMRDLSGLNLLTIPPDQIGSDRPVKLMVNHLQSSAYISCISDYPVVILIATEVKIAETGNLSTILSEFESRMKLGELRLNNLSVKNDKFKEEAKTNQNRLIELRSVLTNNGFTLSALLDEEKSVKRSAKNQYDGYRESVNKIKTSLETLKTDDKCKLTRSLSSILTTAKVDVSKFAKFDIEMGRLEGCVKTLEGTIQTINTLETILID